MLAGAKAEMPLRSTIDVIDIRVGKFPPVAISGSEGQGHFVADAQGLAVQCDLAHDGALETLRRGVDPQRLLDCRFDQRGVGDDPAPRVRIIVQIERKHAHEARERFHSCHDEGCRRKHDLALAQPVTIDLGFGEMSDEIVCRFRAARGHLGGQEGAELLKSGDVLGGASLDRFVGRNGQDNLAPDFGVITLGQAHRPEQQADRDLAGEIVDELEFPPLAYALERAVGNIERGRDQLLDGFARERGLAQRPQPVVAGRIGRS